MEPGEPNLFFRQKQLSQYDAILPRIGASITYFGTAVVRQFEQMDVFSANSSAGIANSRDKLRSMQILSKHQIGIPTTTFVRDRKDVLPAIDRVGGAPVIIKLLEGKTIDESGLPEKDINVLTLYRGTTVIPNPRLKRTLESGDRLLCFGKLNSMKGMIPKRVRKKRTPKVQSLA